MIPAPPMCLQRSHCSMRPSHIFVRQRAGRQSLKPPRLIAYVFKIQPTYRSLIFASSHVSFPGGVKQQSHPPNDAAIGIKKRRRLRALVAV